MTIRTQLRVNILFSIGLAVIVVGVLLYANRRIDRSMEQNLLADRISRSIYELFTVARTYITYGEERPRVQWELEFASLQKLIQESRTGGGERSEELRIISENAEEMGGLFAQIVSYVERAKRSSGEEAVLLQEVTERLTARVMAMGQEMVNQAFLLILESNRMLASAKRNAIALVIAATLLTLAITAAMSLLLSRRILTGLRTLQAGTERVAGGDLHHRLEMASGDELGRLATAFDRMTRRLAVSEREREEIIRQLARSNRELEEFAFVASHDLQEPLRKIQTFGERLAGKGGELLGEGGRDYLARMQNAAARMQTLIEDLLSYSRVTTRPEPFTPVALAPLVQEVVADLSARIEQTGGCVEVGDLPVIESSPHQMRQLFQNLLGNSLKFHGAEPPLLRVSARPAPDPDGETVEIRVSDNGIGFEEKYLDRIFQPFQRLHGRSHYEGTGMGLAICRKIVERHGGTITAKSAPATGATFIITLPVRQASNAASLTSEGGRSDGAEV